MPDNNYGAYHLGDNPTLYEPQRTNNFVFVVSDIDDILRSSPSSYSTSNSRIANAQSVLYYSVSSVQLPHFQQSPIEIRRGNSSIKVAGVPSFSGGSLTVHDYIGADPKSVLMAWQALSYNVETEAVGRMAEYKKDCTLIEYTPDYTEVVRYYDLKGCWISNLSEDARNHDDNKNSMVTVEIQYDRASMRLPDVEQEI